MLLYLYLILLILNCLQGSTTFLSTDLRQMMSHQLWGTPGLLALMVYTRTERHSNLHNAPWMVGVSTFHPIWM